MVCQIPLCTVLPSIYKLVLYDSLTDLSAARHVSTCFIHIFVQITGPGEQHNLSLLLDTVGMYLKGWVLCQLSMVISQSLV